MTVQIQRLEKWTDIVRAAQAEMKTEREKLTLKNCLGLSACIWEGKVGDIAVCMWGLIPPTLMSEQAYLWLYTTPEMEEHKFLLVRYSQRMMEVMLQDFPLITGQCSVENDQAIRWVKWLGGKFGEPEGKMVPFMIRRKDG